MYVGEKETAYGLYSKCEWVEFTLNEDIMDKVNVVIYEYSFTERDRVLCMIILQS
jgi:hypothetical protein